MSNFSGFQHFLGQEDLKASFSKELNENLTFFAISRRWQFSRFLTPTPLPSTFQQNAYEEDF